ncbi:MAG: hypothetical protein AUJ52_02950 [Elusimicrobia bacterium CG1_02_63_36]|nr:MAG: hypothetical protein AUJ52_02950 [Elusimicrobia bacterium CG1_02_63_36]
MRVAIACGGTGGHFYPGYALSQELRKRGHETLFLVRDGDPARESLAAADLPSVEIRLRGLSRRPSLSWLSAPFQTLFALRTLARVFRSYRPHAVAGMGAYLTGAAAVAARLCGIPIVLHEANARLGLSNRACARIADALALGLPLAEKPPVGLAPVLTGTPIRPELHRAGDAGAARAALGLEPGLKTVLILGGSQGSRALNTRVPGALAALGAPLQAYHLCGKGRLEETRAAYAAAGPGVTAVVAEYDADMARAFSAADAAVCRAGASTAAELLAAALPAVLVPYPYAAGDHQAFNARALERTGLYRMLREEALGEKTLSDALAALPDRSAADPGSEIGLPRPEESASRLADVVEEAAKTIE